MSEEKELQEPNLEEAELDGLADFVDFADLGDLDTASNLEVFGELGDIGDLGDIPDLSESLDASDGAPAMEDLSDVPVPDIAEDIPLPDMAELEDLSDVPLPDLSGEGAVSDEAPLPELAEDTETLEPPLPDLSEEAEISALDEEVTIKSVDPQPDAPDIFSDSSEAEDLFKESDDTDGQDSDLTDGVILDDALAGVLDEPMGDVSKEMDLEGSLPDVDAGGDAAPDAAAMDSLEDGMGLDDNSIDDVLSELDLGDEAVSIDDVLGAPDGSETAEASVDEGGSIDSMLGGLLDNLDMNGSLEEPEMAVSEEADGMADILNLGSNPFGGADSIEELGVDSEVENMLDVSEMIPDAVSGMNGAEGKEPGLFEESFWQCHNR